MPHPTPVALTLALLLALVACGDSSESKPKPPSTPAEAIEAMKRSFGATAADRTATAERIKSASTRPLTSADVEALLEFIPAMKAVEGDKKKQAELMTAKVLSTPEWSILFGRIMLAAGEAKSPRPDSKRAADVEVVRPYLDRLEGTPPLR